MIPIIKLTTDHMRQEVVHAFDTQQAQYREEIEKGLKEAVENFDFAREVSEQATDHLRQMCETLVRETVREVVWDPEFRGKLKEMLIKTLKETEP